MVATRRFEKLETAEGLGVQPQAAVAGTTRTAHPTTIDIERGRMAWRGGRPTTDDADVETRPPAPGPQNGQLEQAQHEPSGIGLAEAIECRVNCLEEIVADFMLDRYFIRDLDDMHRRRVARYRLDEGRPGRAHHGAFEERHLTVPPTLKIEADARENLQRTREAPARTLRPLGDAGELAKVARQNGHDAIGLTEVDRAQHDRGSAQARPACHDPQVAPATASPKPPAREDLGPGHVDRPRLATRMSWRSISVQISVPVTLTGLGADLSFSRLAGRGSPVRGFQVQMSTNGFDDSEENGARVRPADPASDPAEIGPEPLPATIEEAHARIRELAADLSARADDAAGLADRVLRERAELENFKRRMQRDRAEAARYAGEPLLREILPALDNLQRALAASAEAAAGNPAIASLREGVAMVLQQLLAGLAQHGLRRVEAAGQVFDPAEHEALGQIESTALPAGSILIEHDPGYRLHDRLLRPARVTVSRGPGPAVGN